MSGTLRVVGTPIGNLEDISPRAVRAMAQAGVIYCEDTRRTRGLLSAMGVPAPRLVRLDRHTEVRLLDAALASLADGEDAALVSDAGMPTVSDPGADLVRAVAAAGFPLEVVPGPCAVSAALALAGFPADRYRFAGFLPRRGSERTAALASLAAEATTAVLYESPHRVAATLADLAAACGPDRPVAALREMTKVHEEAWRGDLGGAVEWMAGREARGEWVIVLGPALPPPPSEVGDDEIRRALVERIEAGGGTREAAAAVAAQLAVPRRRVYDMAVTLRRR